MNHACFKFPYSDEIHICAQLSGDLLGLGDPADLFGLSGFVIAPFVASIETPLILIRSDLCFTSSQKKEIADFLQANHLLEKGESLNSSYPTETEAYTAYQNAFSKGMKLLETGELQKFVLSRTYFRKNVQHSDYELFIKATELYPDDFVVWFDTDRTGSWLSVTPELLMSERRGVCSMAALAATRQISDSTGQVVWDEKDRLEQRLVADYIKGILLSMKVSFSQGDVQTIRAGNLFHLKSLFQFHPKKECPGMLLRMLHPTPAVCGLPKVTAFEFIRKNEPVPREYYSGYTGCFNLLERTELYVTLRCMKRVGQGAVLYAGGGILPMSDMKKEWLETESKLLTIKELF